MGLDFVWIDEANASREDLNEVFARMRGRAARCNNPSYTQTQTSALIIYVRGKASCYYSPTRQHQPASYEGTLSMLTGIQLLRLKEGSGCKPRDGIRRV